MRHTGERLIDPHAGHGRIARQAFGVRAGRETDDDVRIAIEQPGNAPATARRRITGEVASEAMGELIAQGARAGYWDDETTAAPDLGPTPYENNAGLLFRGTAPSRANGAASVIGTGGDVVLNDATDSSGRITVTTGTGVSAAGAICTISFARPKRNADYQVLLSAADSDASMAAGRSVYSNFGDRTTTAWVLACSTALAPSTSYHWSYLVIEVESL